MAIWYSTRHSEEARVHHTDRDDPQRSDPCPQLGHTELGVDDQVGDRCRASESDVDGIARRGDCIAMWHMRRLASDRELQLIERHDTKRRAQACRYSDGLVGRALVRELARDQADDRLLEEAPFVIGIAARVRVKQCAYLVTSLRVTLVGATTSSDR